MLGLSFAAATPTPPPPPSPSGGGISDIISRELFDQMLKHRNDPRCQAGGFYTYDAFVTAAAYFHGFGTTGDTATRQREIAAFLGQTSHETTGEQERTWTPSAAEVAAGRLPGYGVTTNIINGGCECGIGPDSKVEDRIGFYKRYCDMFGIDYGENLDCANQRHFGSVGFLMDTM
ncbi:hypothetical protein LguiB_020962 [Lonicera macranthoides]